MALANIIGIGLLLLIAIAAAIVSQHDMDSADDNRGDDNLTYTKENSND